MLLPLGSSSIAIVALVLAATPRLAAQEPPAPTPPTPAAPPAPPAASETPAAPSAPAARPADDHFRVGDLEVRGSFSLLYRYRHTSGASDQDVYGLLSTDVGDADTQPLTFHVVGRSAYDLDGHTDHRGAYAFDSLADTYDRRLTALLLEAWAGGHLNGPVASWKLGRMFVDDTPVQTYVDGGRVDSAVATTLRLQAGVYGGVPTHLYESSTQGDAILGAYVSGRPFDSTKARLDYMHVDDRDFFDSHHDDLLGASLWQTCGDHVDVFGRMTWLESEARDLTANATWADPVGTWHVQASYHELFKTQRDRSYEFDPFFEAAFDYFPYRQVGLRASRGFGDHFDLAAGADVRRLVSQSDSGTFNHDFERYYLTPTLIGLPDPKTTIALMGEWWNGSEDHFATVGFDVAHELAADLRAHAGTNYSLWKYDLYQNRELDRVRTWFLGLDWRTSKRLRLRGDYEYEDSDLGRFHTLRMRATWTF